MSDGRREAGYVPANEQELNLEDRLASEAKRALHSLREMSAVVWRNAVMRIQELRGVLSTDTSPYSSQLTHEQRVELAKKVQELTSELTILPQKETMIQGAIDNLALGTPESSGQYIVDIANWLERASAILTEYEDLGGTFVEDPEFVIPLELESFSVDLEGCNSLAMQYDIHQDAMLTSAGGGVTDERRTADRSMMFSTVIQSIKKADFDVSIFRFDFAQPVIVNIQRMVDALAVLSSTPEVQRNNGNDKIKSIIRVCKGQLERSVSFR